MGKRDRRRRKKKIREREIVNQLEGVKASHQRRESAQQILALEAENLCSDDDSAGTIDETSEEPHCVPSERSIAEQVPATSSAP